MKSMKWNHVPSFMDLGLMLQSREEEKRTRKKKCSCDLNAFRNMALIKLTQKLLHYQYTTHIQIAFQNFKQCECDQMKLHNKMAEPDGISFVIISLHYQHFSSPPTFQFTTNISVHHPHFSSLPTFQFTTNIFLSNHSNYTC